MHAPEIARELLEHRPAEEGPINPDLMTSTIQILAISLDELIRP
jgi:hypothetical protein